MRSNASVSIPEYGLWLRLLEEYCIVEQASNFVVVPRYFLNALPARYFLNALTICAPKKILFSPGVAQLSSRKIWARARGYYRKDRWMPGAYMQEKLGRDSKKE
jgi:hypothetical protein